MNIRLDKTEFITMGVLTHSRGFKVLARITYMVEMPPSSLEKTMDNIHKVKMAELPWQNIEGGFKELRELVTLEQMLCKTRNPTNCFYLLGWSKGHSFL